MRLIEAARGPDTFSTWVREACARRLEAEAGLGPEMRSDINALVAQMRGLDINLNQLARGAAGGREPGFPRRHLAHDSRDSRYSGRGTPAATAVTTFTCERPTTY